MLQCFEEAINQNGELWPSRVRVCDATVGYRGEGRGSFIAGPSTSNQRIERLWRDVYRCVCHFFYYHFYAMEQTGYLDLENPVHMFVLHIVYTARINCALNEFMGMFNNHRLFTERNATPNQLWSNGMLDSRNPLACNDIE